MIFITFKYRYRKQIIIGILLTILIVSISVPIAIKLKKKSKTEEKDQTILLSKKEDISSKEEHDKTESNKEELLKVDIKGEVISPGIYSLKKESRVIDVIEIAGGLTQEANTTVINLSKKITDEMVIIIYSNQEVSDFKKTKEIEKQVQQNCIQKDENSLKNDACITTETNTSVKISINTATKELLQSLPGIGESKAQDIIDYREENGPFETIEDLTKVSGIGESLLAKIKENITT